MFFGSLNKSTVERLKNEYPAGTRVEFISMDDPYGHLDEGDMGTVRYVDDVGTVHVNWDCGSSLGMVYGIDRWRKLS